MKKYVNPFNNSDFKQMFLVTVNKPCTTAGNLPSSFTQKYFNFGDVSWLSYLTFLVTVNKPCTTAGNLIVSFTQKYFNFGDVSWLSYLALPLAHPTHSCSATTVSKMKVQTYKHLGFNHSSVDWLICSELLFCCTLYLSSVNEEILFFFLGDK